MNPSYSSNIHVLQHPLLQHKLTLLRDTNTAKKLFNELVHEITIMLAYEATRSLPTQAKIVQTPIATTEGAEIAEKKCVILPILRAGLSMVNGFLTLMPAAPVGHIGLFRDEKTLEPKEYYFRIPQHSEQRRIFVCDPMLATGGSACRAIHQLKKRNIHQIIFVCLVAAPEGIQRLQQEHPETPVYTACIDQQLNEQGFIVPGLGDAGDRLFGTQEDV